MVPLRYIFVLAGVYLLPAAARAQGIENPLRVDSIAELVRIVIQDIIFPIGIPIVTIAIIYAGFLFVSAQGDKTKLETAKKTLLWTLVGAGVFLGAWVFAQVIAGTIEQLRG